MTTHFSHLLFLLLVFEDIFLEHSFHLTKGLTTDKLSDHLHGWQCLCKTSGGMTVWPSHLNILINSSMLVNIPNSLLIVQWLNTCIGNFFIKNTLCS
jgi:hypothetical protein